MLETSAVLPLLIMLLSPAGTSCVWNGQPWPHLMGAQGSHLGSDTCVVIREMESPCAHIFASF